MEVENEVSSNAYSAAEEFSYGTGNTHFDEANLYYHVDKFRNNYVNGLGSLGFTQITAHAHKNTGYGPNNAWFLRSDQEIYFGDGTGTGFNPFSREDKVIYHEYGHAVIYDIETGIISSNSEEGAISEGVPDYFAGAHTGRSLILEYAAYDYRRDMADPLEIDSYAEYQSRGSVEAHDGGEFFSAILWDLRGDGGISGGQADFLVFDALDRVTGNPDFEEFLDAMIAADNSAYSGNHVSLIESTFCAWGVGSDCAPDAPTNLDVSGSTGQNPSLTWTASTGATGYDVYRCANVSYNCSNFTYIGSTSNTSYTDTEKTIGTQCGVGPDEITWYYVIATNAAGESDPSNDDSTCTDASKQDVASAEPVPAVFALRGNYPNPFNPTTTINLDLPETAEVTVEVIDMLGRVVLQVSSQQIEAGVNRSVELDASHLATGAYLYRVVARTAEHVQVGTGRLTLVK